VTKRIARGQRQSFKRLGPTRTLRAKPAVPGRYKRIKAAVAAGLVLSALIPLSRVLTADIKPQPKDPVQVIDATTLELSDDAIANLDLTAVSQQDFPDVLSIMGSISVVENRVTSVPARTAGRIDAVLKVSGEYVHAGDALALEFSPDFVAARQEYLEALQRDVSIQARSLSDAAMTQDSDYTNLAAMSKKKLKNMGLSDQDIEALPNSKDDSHLVIRAVRDGAITAVNTSIGNMQNQGDALMTISDLDQVWFSGDLYSEDLGKVHHGQRIQIQAQGLKRPVTGVLSFISPVIDAGAHTIKVRALVENPDRVLRGGMVVQGDLVLSSKPALVIPEAALINLHNQYFCFKSIGPNRFQEVPVEVEHENGELATLSSGLKAGDQVVSAGAIVLDQAFLGGDGD
jgi:Cu(I)/Ag(I) efflux system membrane fusion protein